MIPESIEVQQHRHSVARKAAYRSLESRVRRRLRVGGLILHKSRGEKQEWMLGRYWVTDKLMVMPILHHVDLPDLATRLGIWFGDLPVG